MQVCRIDKYEAHGFIDGTLDNKIMLFSFDKAKGISDPGKRIRKKRGKRLVDRASIIIYSVNISRHENHRYTFEIHQYT